MTSTKIASQTKLPPSPETKGTIPHHHFERDFLTLDHDDTTADNSSRRRRRLRSIACYESFHPQALACSPPLHNHTTTTDVGVVLPPAASPRQAAATGGETTTSSLGAVAGSDGVALFRVAKPHVPLMMLSHASSNKNSTTTTYLSFQPETSKSLYLASARGSGVLVWDVSGHSLSPLWGRVGVEQAGSASPAAAAEAPRPPAVATKNNVTSLSWTRTAAPWLAATTASSACLWDLRQSAFRPSLRFAANNASTTGTAPPYLQIACSGSIECAILDAAGMVRVYDTRVTDRRAGANGSNTVCQFEACKHAGVGLSFFKENCWVTWGLDAPNMDAIVKIWSSSVSEEAAENANTVPSAPPPAEDYWYMDGSPDRPKSIKFISSAATSKSIAPEYRRYRMIAQCTTRNLACARVCPSPVEDSIVTVGLDPQEGLSEASWRAELWKLKSVSSDDSFEESSLERIVSFEGSSDTGLRSVMGQDSRLRSLRASELAISSYAGTVSPHSRDDSSGNSGLMLCCLTENGFVTTHAIPEALPNDQATTRKDSSGDLLAGSSHSGPRGISSATAPAKLFPTEPEIAINDAAHTWVTPKESLWGKTRHSSLGKLDVAAVESGGRSISGVAPGAEEGLMPFDMDVPVAYSMASPGVAGLPSSGINELVSPSALSAMSSIDDNDQADNVVRDTAAFMERIETERIPCPRLCGATFSSGVGGMAAFHNGGVTKMWHWWERSDPTRLAAVPGLIGEPSLNDPKRPKSPVFIEDESSGLPKLTSNCPRTLKDLIDMMGAAKEAQWGDQDQSEHSSTGFPALGDNFFEDDSDASSDLGDEQSDELHDTHDLKERIGEQRVLVQPATHNQDSLDPIDKQGASDNIFSSTVGPSSDMLAPIVKVSHEYDRIALNNQSIEFAERWQLGDLHDNSDEICKQSLDVVTKPKQHNRLPKSDGALNVPIGGVLHGTGESPPRRVLPSYRSLLPSPPTPAKSVPQQRNSPPALTEPVHSDDERGVHGGEYSNFRPNMQESMVFLRKLFTHQQQDGGTFRNMRTPPDSPMLSKPTKSGQISSLSPDFGSRRNEKGSSNNAEQMQLGVYVLRAEMPSKHGEDDELMKIRDICLHNAKVCESLGDQEKKAVWELIAKTVLSRIKYAGRGFDGWCGPGGGALGVGLVSSFLRYYESLGDVQMLSTLVCVLRGRRQQNAAYGKRQDWLLVPSDHDARYDMYIRRYADLLYGWGLLTRRAELNKHLTRGIAPIESGVVDRTEGPNDGRSKPGIALVFKCPRCAGSSEFGANYCRSCKDFVFRCSICDNAVWGLFTVCDSCGHGGHVNHMKEWFSFHEDCPSGCGCNCKFAASASLQRETELMTQAAPSSVMPLAQTAQQASYVAS